MGLKKDQGHELVKAAAKGAAAAGVVSGGDITAVGIGALAGAVGHVASATLDQVREGIARSRGVEGPLGEATVVELDERAPELEAKLARLLEAAGDDQAKRARAVASFEALIHAWMKAGRRAADDRKRRILMAALVSGLDEEAYREGLALTIIEHLERLDYGATRLLVRVSEGDGDSDKLAAAMAETDMCGHFHRLLKDSKLITHDGGRVTPLGRRVVSFIHKELQDHMREDGGDAA